MNENSILLANTENINESPEKKYINYKEILIEIFRNKIKNVKLDLSNYNNKHCGKEGHLLEEFFNINKNSNCKADIYGYELKKSSKYKITFGDWSADYYIYKDINYNITREMFIKYFGKKNPKKHNRYSWSGYGVPVYLNETTDFGQTLNIDEDKNIIITYDYNLDKRDNKDEIIPDFLRNQTIIIVKWNVNTIEKKITDKFGNKGFFICIKNNENNLYEKIAFGKPFSYDFFIENMKNKNIFFDSGMYNGNQRNYSHFRGKTSFWYENANEIYE